MQNHPGTFIVLEGADGSGKGTQFRLLRERLIAVGYDVEVFDFPRYESGSSYFVQRYLNGDYGSAKLISPYTASLFYALDRFEAAPSIRRALSEGKVVLCNRYAGSNMAHQGGKLAGLVEQRSFFVWADSLEFQLLGIPRPTINIFLRVPADISQELIGKKQERSYTLKSHDEHEKDLGHLKNSIETYDLLCQLFPKDFQAIDCVEGNHLLSIPEVNNIIWETIQPILPPPATEKAHSVTLNLKSKIEPSKVVSNHQTRYKTPAKPSKRTSVQEPHSLDSMVLAKSLSPHSVAINLSQLVRSESYFQPKGLAQKTLNKYNESLKAISQLRMQIRKKSLGSVQGQELLRLTVPGATLLSASFSPDREAADRLIAGLRTSMRPEAKLLAEGLEETVQQLQPKAPKAYPPRNYGRDPEPLNDIISRLVNEHLPQHMDRQPQTVELLEASPRNEFKILLDSIYPLSNLPRDEIETQIDRWNYQRKYEALEAALDATETALAEQISYHFDVTIDRLTLLELLDLKITDSVRLQPPTPRYGYEVPTLADELGVADDFMSCFDKSLELFSTLQAAGREDLAPYAVLTGHKTRFQFTCSLAAFKSARAHKLSVRVDSILDLMLEKIQEVHPIVGSMLSLKSTNRASKSTKRAQKVPPGRRHQTRKQRP